MINLSVIICTYNRSRLLKKCLNSFLLQLNDEIEIIVIDNNSPDDTAKVVSEYNTKYKNIVYVFEHKVGLSHARNRGIKESKADWILYLDDDAIAFPNLFERALYLINRGDFDCVGGMYYGYYEAGDVKWVPEFFSSKTLFSKDLSECPYSVPTGGIVLYKKNPVIDVGMFNANFGMQGNNIGYGEETELQKKLFEYGYKIGFDPFLKINHLVRKEKYKLSWQLRAIFQIGYYGDYFGNRKSFLVRLYLLLKSIIGIMIKRLPLNFIRFVSHKNYGWNKMIYETLEGGLKNLGAFLYYIKVSIK